MITNIAIVIIAVLAAIISSFITARMITLYYVKLLNKFIDSNLKMFEELITEFVKGKKHGQQN